MEYVRISPMITCGSLVGAIAALAVSSPTVLAQDHSLQASARGTTFRVAQLDDLVEADQEAKLRQLQLQVEAEKLRLQEEKLRLENENFQLEQDQLELRRGVLERKNEQLGLTSNSQAISIESAGSEFSERLDTVPIESKILVFQSSNEIAKAIADELIELSQSSDSYGISSIVVYEPEEFANVNSYRVYENLRAGLVSAYGAEGIGLQPQSLQPNFLSDGIRGGLNASGVSGIVQGSTTALRSVAEIFSYFRSEEVLFPNAFEPDGNGFLIAQLVAALRRAKSSIQVYAPAVYLNNFSDYENPIETFLVGLDEIAFLKSQAQQVIGRSSDARKIQRLQNLNAQASQLLNLLRFAESGEGQGASGSNSAQIFRLIQGAQISELLNSEDKRVLILDLLESGGSSRTRRSLFSTMFTGKKTSYSGGAAVQYFLVNPDNSLASANVLYRNSGFRAMQRARGN